MGRPSREAILFFMPVWGGVHLGSWRHPHAPSDWSADLALYRSLARIAERGKFHAFFLADDLGMRHQASLEALARSAVAVRPVEPITLAAALGECTERIGFVLTASTTFSEPYNVARYFASLDHLTGGRAGWNVVTTGNVDVARNFGGGEMMGHGLRYERADEFVEVVKGLWDSFDDDACVRDKDGGIFFDVEKVHPLNHIGKYFSVAGPLNVARPPQGYPLMVQAGSSEAGKAFAAKIAEAIFVIERTLPEAQQFYTEIKDAVANNGRNPEHLKVLGGLHVIVRRSQAEADEHLAQLDELIDDAVGLAFLSSMVEMDLSGYPLDGPFPDVPETSRGMKSRQQNFVEKAHRDNMTIREMIRWCARTAIVAGTPEMVADYMEERLVGDAVDGFNVIATDNTPAFLEQFVDLLVPELQRRGLFRKEYSGLTLRENMGLPRPPSQYAGAHAMGPARG